MAKTWTQGQGQDKDFQRVLRDNPMPGPRPRNNITGTSSLYLCFIRRTVFFYICCCWSVFVTAFAVRGRYINRFYITLHYKLRYTLFHIYFRFQFAISNFPLTRDLSIILLYLHFSYFREKRIWSFIRVAECNWAKQAVLTDVIHVAKQLLSRATVYWEIMIVKCHISNLSNKFVVTAR